MRQPLEKVWSECSVVLLNRRLSEAERQRIQGRARPHVVDVYQNEL